MKDARGGPFGIQALNRRRRRPPFHAFAPWRSATTPALLVVTFERALYLCTLVAIRGRTNAIWRNLRRRLAFTWTYRSTSRFRLQARIRVGRPYLPIYLALLPPLKCGR